jgi:hypothetical protein
MDPPKVTLGESACRRNAAPITIQKETSSYGRPRWLWSSPAMLLAWFRANAKVPLKRHELCLTGFITRKTTECESKPMKEL